MAEFYLTNKAIEDLNKIWNYTCNKWSEEQADKNYEGVETNLFGLKTNRHIIFYRKIERNIIEITRILHGRMDLKYKITK